MQEANGNEARPAAPGTLTISAKKAHEIRDERSTTFDVEWVQQTISTESPGKISAVLADFISIRVALQFDYEAAGFTDNEWSDIFRAVWRPRAGKVFTVNVRESFASLFPRCLPQDIFIQDADNQESKFKLRWKGETVTAPFNPSTSDTRWAHLFTPATYLGSKAEFMIAVKGKFEEVGMHLKTEDRDFKCIDPKEGKWTANFEIKSGNMVAENLYKLAKFEVEKSGIKTYLSPQFMEKLPENCNRCFTWLKFNECFCPKKDVRKDGYKRAKDGEAAAQRKRRFQAASSSSAAF
jgi:hypothetical protein